MKLTLIILSKQVVVGPAPDAPHVSSSSLPPTEDNRQRPLHLQTLSICIASIPNQSFSHSIFPVSFFEYCKILRPTFLKPNTLRSPNMTDYASLKVPELKKLLAERSLPQSGNKADLIQRLQDNDKSTFHISSQRDRNRHLRARTLRSSMNLARATIPIHLSS